MYRWLRNTHLFLGLFALLSVLMYGVSSVKMSHRSWIPTAPEVTESRAILSPEVGASARAAARELMDKHGLRGELSGGRAIPDGFTFRIARPGTSYEVHYTRQTGEARIQTRKMRRCWSALFSHFRSSCFR